MTKKEIEQVGKYFECYSEAPYRDAYGYHDNEICKKFFHKEYDSFHIAIFQETNSVYQLNTDHEIYGIELETFENLEMRFFSFTGDHVHNVEDDNYYNQK